ncbi:MAG: hypothetical protein P3A29_08840, partial [Gemmatimonadota bacterium]|nr:hypothetical protein [Gemmatimonadota bacterium]
MRESPTAVVRSTRAPDGPNTTRATSSTDSETTVAMYSRVGGAGACCAATPGPASSPRAHARPP